MLLKQDVLDQELNEDRQEPLLLTYDNPSVQNAAVLAMTLPGMPNLRDIYIKVSPSKPQADQHNRIAYSTLVIQMAGLLIEQIKYLTDYKDPSPLDQPTLAALYDLCQQGLPWLKEAIATQDTSISLIKPTRPSASSVGSLRAKLLGMTAMPQVRNTPQESDTEIQDLQESVIKKQKTSNGEAVIREFEQPPPEGDPTQTLHPDTRAVLGRYHLAEGDSIFASCYVNWEVQKPLRSNPSQHKNYACDGIELCIMAKVETLVLRTGNPFTFRVQHQQDCASTSWYLHSLPRANYEHINKQIIAFLAAYCEDKPYHWKNLDSTNKVVRL